MSAINSQTPKIIRLVILFAAYIAIALILASVWVDTNTWQYWAIMVLVAVVHTVA